MDELKDLIGKTMISVENYNDVELIFVTTEGKRFMLYHQQDCCEKVSIESIVGDLSDLIGEPILMSEEVSGEAQSDSMYSEGSFTWTFYKFATRKGYVDVRWLGKSNGYYSERVSFSEVTRHLI